MNRAALVITVACLLLAPAAARAQGDPLARLDAGARASVTRTIAEAREAGLPTQPLVDKALEGVRKRAPGARIVVAVSALRTRLATARAALLPEPAPEDIVSGADALAAGVPVEALRTVRALRPDRPVALPLAVLAQLVAQGVPVPRASRMVEDLIRRGAQAEHLVALNAQVQADVAAGVEADDALDVRARGLIAVLGASSGSGATAASAPTGMVPATGDGRPGARPPTTRP